MCGENQKPAYSVGSPARLPLTETDMFVDFTEK